VRTWQASDKSKLLKLYGLESVIKWVDDGNPLTKAEADAWMIKTRSNYEIYGYGMFAIEDRNGNDLVGFGGLVHPGGQSKAEAKYAFFPTVWGRGIATEFLAGLLHYASQKLGLVEIIATVAVENEASKNVLLKSGFNYCATRTESDGSRIDTFSIGIAPQGNRSG